VQWAVRCPAAPGDTIEVRQVQEFEDFPADVQRAAEPMKDMQAQIGQRKGA
jgi:hypothetical protein